MNDAHHFIAITVPKKIQPVLSDAQKNLAVSNYFKKVTNAEDFHITLLFLGGWDREKKEQLWNNLEKTLTQQTLFSLRLENIGAFGSKNQPRVVWVGVKREEKLERLQVTVSNEAAKLGFPIEKRPFRPHITLAKGNRGNDITFVLKESLNFSNQSWEVSGIELLEIKPGQSPMYKPVSKIHFSM